jgi:hypothetical protein
MYSRKSWGGSVDPYILVKFMKPPPEQKAASVSLVIFEWKDEELVGVFPEGAAPGTPVCMTSMFNPWPIANQSHRKNISAPKAMSRRSFATRRT